MEYESFEGAFEHLKSIVQEFEGIDNVSLENLLIKYEQGMKAYNFCIKKLDDTQKKIKIIDSNYE